MKQAFVVICRSCRQREAVGSVIREAGALFTRFVVGDALKVWCEPCGVAEAEEYNRYVEAIVVVRRW